ncbi:MAG: hypothetical protein ABWY06_03185 [Pseudomonas sp.]|uniref:hypothetical protein n=1 Tax=Pseudomonas sp. TaxID=306 RepID=UPI0033972A93
MKRLLWTVACCLTAICAQASEPTTPYPGLESPAHTVISCAMADASSATLLAQPNGYALEILSVRLDGKTERAFQDMPDIEFAGEVALATCVDKALLFVLQGGSPYLKGELIRKNPHSQAVEHLYFAEKSLPGWLYLNERQMLLVFANEGHETDKPYLVYRYVAGEGQPSESEATDQRPVQDGYTVMRITP